MKQLVLLLLFICTTQTTMAGEKTNFIVSDMLASLQPGDKAALLVVHFGSTYDDTRALTIEPFNRKVKETFPALEMREAFTSRIVMRRLKARGIEKHNPLEALGHLKEEGFTHIIVQSSNIIEGIEMEALRREIADIEHNFKDIRIGNPLLYRTEDYEAVIDALTEEPISGKAVVWVGHGTYTPATAQYAMLDHILKAKGFTNYYVTTIEGYPTLDDTEAELREDEITQIILQPFMFVAGDHARNDIAGEMKEELEELGYEVEVRMEGLGQNPAILDIFIEHIQFSLHHKMKDIIKTKKQYETDTNL